MKAFRVWHFAEIRSAGSDPALAEPIDAQLRETREIDNDSGVPTNAGHGLRRTLTGFDDAYLPEDESRHG